MRASKVGLIGVVGGAAIYALRTTGLGRRALDQLDRGRSGEDVSTQQVVSTASQEGGTKEVWPDVATEFHTDPDRVAAEREEQADRPVDATADASGLVAAERDALTVAGDEGEDHRRRDQTAGEAAQDIAAAQVRARRSSEGDYDD